MDLKNSNFVQACHSKGAILLSAFYEADKAIEILFLKVIKGEVIDNLKKNVICT